MDPTIQKKRITLGKRALGKLCRVAKAVAPLDPTQQEQRVAHGKLDKVTLGKLHMASYTVGCHLAWTHQAEEEGSPR
jgi:hypothetical protein